jgi:hypothetical protein
MGRLTSSVTQVRQVGILQPLAGGQISFFIISMNMEKVTIYNNMWDDKSCTSIAKTFLETNKKLSSSRSTNNGNTARTFFLKNQAVTANILGIDRNIICLFAELLDMFNDPVNKPCSKVFETKADSCLNFSSLLLWNNSR